MPHEDNISYFGAGDEAHMVYNFALPPLTLFTFMRGDAAHLSAWLSEQGLPAYPNCHYFQFLDSHDGIGVTPLVGILPQAQIDALIAYAQRNGGRVSYKNQAGVDKPYELNTTWWSCLYRADEPMSANIDRYLASRAVALSLKGVPGVYLHGLLGSDNFLDAPNLDSSFRDINRRDLDIAELEAQLERDGGKTGEVFKRYIRLLELRRGEPAFAPVAAQRILDLDRRVLAVERRCESDTILALINVSHQAAALSLPYSGRDIISGKSVDGDTTLQPYHVIWLKPRQT